MHLPGRHGGGAQFNSKPPRHARGRSEAQEPSVFSDQLRPDVEATLTHEPRLREVSCCEPDAMRPRVVPQESRADPQRIRCRVDARVVPELRKVHVGLQVAREVRLKVHLLRDDHRGHAAHTRGPGLSAGTPSATLQYGHTAIGLVCVSVCVSRCVS